MIGCRSPLLARERSRQREDLLRETEQKLGVIVAATQGTTRPLNGKEQIGLRVGKVLNSYKAGKHFRIEIADRRFIYARDAESIAEEAALDGFYVIRTSVPARVLESEDTVRAYRNLSAVERAFRSLKRVDLKIRPIYHHLADRVRAHVFLCMLAYYVEWHMERALAPIRFDDDDKAVAAVLRSSVVAPAQRSLRARSKSQTRRTEEGLPVHSFQTLLKDLATIVKNRVHPKAAPAAATFDMLTTPTTLQQRALELLEVELDL